MAEVQGGVLNPYGEKNYDLSGHNYGTNNEYEISYFFSLFLSIMLVCILFSNLVGQRWKLEYFPEAGAPLLVGIAAGILCVLHSDTVTDSLLGFDPTIFFIALLPPIIFNSGYSMKRRFFFQNFLRILTFAIGGTLMSTMATGILLYLVGRSGWSVELSLAECLTFGSLISATDPVSTLGVFKELQVDPVLFYLVFGESVLNDAVAIVLFRTFSKFVGYTHTFHSVVIAIADFMLIFVGSTALGVLFGCMSALLFKFFNFKTQHIHEISVLLLFAYLPFLVAEAVQMSGIVSILFAGMTMKHYTHNNLSSKAQYGASQIFDTIAYMSESAVFLNLGLSVFALRMGYELKLIAWTILVCLVARALNVYPLSCALNCMQAEKIKRNQQHMLWFSGLRGAIAFALSLSFPGGHRSEIVTTTMAVVVLSVFLMGGSTIPMLRFLNIKRYTQEQLDVLDRETHPARSMKILRLDNALLKPFFTSLAPQVIHTHVASPSGESVLLELPQIRLEEDRDTRTTTTTTTATAMMMMRRTREDDGDDDHATL